MMIAIATPEMINPVADQCEANGVPCLSTLGAVAAVLLRSWRRPGHRLRLDVPLLLGRRPARRSLRRDVELGARPTRRSVCCARTTPTATPLPTRRPASRRERRPPATRSSIPVASRARSADFSSIIGQFKDEGVEIVVGIPIPPDFATFWTQANQQDFNPKLVTMAKAVLFSSAVEALGDIGDGLASEIWWTPDHPVHELAHRRERARAVRSVRAVDRQAMDAVRRLRARPVRGVLRRPRAGRQHRQAGRRRCGGGNQPRHHRRPAEVRRRWSAEERRHDLARRRSVAKDERRQSSSSISS